MTDDHINQLVNDRIARIDEDILGEQATIGNAQQTIANLQAERDVLLAQLGAYNQKLTEYDVLLKAAPADALTKEAMPK